MKETYLLRQTIKKYALNDANELVNKITKKIGKNNALKKYSNLVNKAEQIAKLRYTPPRQKKCWNYLIIQEKFLLNQQKEKTLKF